MIAKVTFLLIIGCATVLAQRDNFWTTLKKFAEQQASGGNNNQESIQNPTSFNPAGLSQADIINILMQQAAANANLNKNNLQTANNQHWSNKVNSNYNTPILDVPYRVVDQVQYFADDAVSRVGGALDKTWDSTHKMAENALTGVQNMGSQGFYDAGNIAKNGLGIFSTFPEIAFGLFTKRNNNNN